MISNVNDKFYYTIYTATTTNNTTSIMFMYLY